MLKLIFSITIPITLIGCASSLSIDHTNYRQAGSSSAILGSYGKILVDNSYEMDGVLTNNIDVAIRTKEKYASNKTYSDSANVSLSKVFSINASPLSESKEEKYTAIVMAPRDINKLQHIIEKKIATSREFKIKAINKNFRFISEVVLSHKYNEIENFNNSANAKLTVNNAGNMAFDIKNSGKLNIKLSDNTIIGYKFRKLCWKNGKMVDTVEDLPSRSQQCPDGTTDKFATSLTS